MPKIYRTVRPVENDQIDYDGLISLTLTINSLDGWDFDQMEYMGTKSDKPDLHRTALIFSKEVEDIPTSMRYIIKEIFEINPDSFNGQTMEEVYDFIHNEFDKRTLDNYAEEEVQKESPRYPENLDNSVMFVADNEEDRVDVTQDTEEKMSNKWDKKEKHMDEEYEDDSER